MKGPEDSPKVKKELDSDGDSIPEVCDSSASSAPEKPWLDSDSEKDAEEEEEDRKAQEAKLALMQRLVKELEANLEKKGTAKDAKREAKAAKGDIKDAKREAKGGKRDEKRVERGAKRDETREDRGVKND